MNKKPGKPSADRKVGKYTIISKIAQGETPEEDARPVFVLHDHAENDVYAHFLKCSLNGFLSNL